MLLGVLWISRVFYDLTVWPYGYRFVCFDVRDVLHQVTKIALISTREWAPGIFTRGAEGSAN